jgi:hypothetical protein
MSAALPATAGSLAAAFSLLGTAKLRALPAMQARAAHVGFSTEAYRRIGLLELAGASGLLLGLTDRRVGAAAATGLLSLLTGAAVSHLRTGDRFGPLLPAGTLAAGLGLYLVLLSKDRS